MSLSTPHFPASPTSPTHTNLTPTEMQDSLSVSVAGSNAKQWFSRTMSFPFASFADSLKRTVMRSGPEPRTCSAPSSPSNHFSVPVRNLSPLRRSHTPIRTDSLRSRINKRKQAERMSQVELTKNVYEQPIVSRCDGWGILARRFKHVHSLWYRISRRTLVLHHASPAGLLADASARVVAPFSPAVPVWPSLLGRQQLLRTSSVVVPFTPRVRLGQMKPLPRRVAA